VDQAAGSGRQEQELILRARIALIAAVALLGAAVFAIAGEQGNPGDCAGSTPEMVDCLMAQHAHWDKQLTIAYQQAMKDAVPAQKEKLREAERAWIKYRDANCGYYAAGEGSIARIDAAACMLNMTQKRAEELRNGGAGPDNPGKEDRD
jgi:uncharacterized protein YecT (DUF1311 family)